MSRQYTTTEQLSVLSDEQLDELEQEFLRQKAEEEAGAGKNRIKKLLGIGAVRALSAGAEGALLGFQGRPISELSILREPRSDIADESTTQEVTLIDPETGEAKTMLVPKGRVLRGIPKSERPVYSFDPMTGKVEETNKISPKGIIRNKRPSLEETKNISIETAQEKAKIITPSENERNFIAEYPQAKKDFESLIEQLTPETTAPFGGFARLSTRRRYLLPEENLRKLQEPYTRILKTFLFGPAGKALTGTEREVLEKAASPTGKSAEEWERDITIAFDTLNNKYEMLASGRLPENNQIPRQTDIPSFSSEEEAELSGYKGIVFINGRKARID